MPAGTGASVLLVQDYLFTTFGDPTHCFAPSKNIKVFCSGGGGFFERDESLGIEQRTSWAAYTVKIEGGGHRKQ